MENNTELYKALLEVSKELPDVKATAENSHFKNKYAKLQDIYAVVKPKLYERGFVIEHKNDFTQNGDGTLKHILVTRLIHVQTGQYTEDRSPIVSEKPGNQGIGSAITYMRRYALCCLLSLAVDEDDDGESERKYHEGQRGSNTANENEGSHEFISPKQVKRFWAICINHKNKDKVEKFKKYIVGKYGSFEQIPADKADELFERLEKEENGTIPA